MNSPKKYAPLFILMTICVMLGAVTRCDAAPKHASKHSQALSKAQEYAEAKAFTHYFLKADMPQLDTRLDYNMIKSLTAVQVNHVVHIIAVRCGVLKSMGQPDMERIAPYDVVYVPCHFAKGSLSSKVVFDPQGKVTGFFWTSYPHL